MDILYTTKGMATGGRMGVAKSEDGRLNVQLSHPVVQPRPATGTDPEQLFACGFAACYASACAFAAKQLGIELPEAPEVVAEVNLAKREDGGFTVLLHLTVTFKGVSQEQAETIAHKGHTICPYSHVVNKDAVSTEVVAVPMMA